MGFEFCGGSPIYLQIIEYIKTQILTKKYKQNEKIPSVRDLSLMFEVNPNTVQKALAELENMGLIYTESTNGKFVTNDGEIIETAIKETINNAVDEFMSKIGGYGLSREEIINIIKGEKL